ncbi:MAG: prolipoprotein diacylglyceryl transferase [Prevotella sp.]|nr:prolipoprotein diacylglyceryl transferase [Prevotella sp.]
MHNLLYIGWQPDEYLLRIGSAGVRWYGVCWLIGLTLGFFLMKWLYKRHKYPDEKFEPLFLYIFIGVLIGGRLGHCLFYEPGYFLTSWDHFIEMLIPMKHLGDGTWKYSGYQGLASHGGVIGMLIGLYLYIKRTKMQPWVVLDFMGLCSGITATFIRLGNLMNSEIIGKVTDVPWAFIFYNVDTYPRHPGQLYEALAYFCFFWLILAIYRKFPHKVGTGLYFGLCLTLIFTFRFAIEYTKELQEAFEAGLPIDMGQILSIPFIALGVWAMVQSRGKGKKEL